MTKTKECRRKKDVCPFLLLENSRPLSPQPPLDFLSTCLGIDSLIFSTSPACELHENISPEREKTLSKCHDDRITVQINDYTESMWRLHSLKISFFFLLPPSFQNRSSRDLISPSPHKEPQWSGWFLSFLYFYTGRHFMTVPLKTEKITTWGAGTLHIVWVKTEHCMNTGYWGDGWAPGQLEGRRQRPRGVVSTSILPTWHTCPSFYLINLILIIWR